MQKTKTLQLIQNWGMKNLFKNIYVINHLNQTIFFLFSRAIIGPLWRTIVL